MGPGAQNGLMNTRSLALLAVGLVVGVVGAYIYFKPAPLIENAKYVVAFKEVAPTNLADFIAAISVPGKAVFRRDMKVWPPLGGPPEQPPGMEDAGIASESSEKQKSGPQPLMGQQVTQRVGFNNKENLEKALSYLSPTPTPSPSLSP